MISPQAQVLINRAARVLLDQGFQNFSPAQSYYTMFYLTEALLYSKDMQFSSHSTVIAAFGKEFAKTGLLDANSIAGSLLQRGDVKPAIMGKKAR
jgi:uncharacterized protein (UPF0332 family)